MFASLVKIQFLQMLGSSFGRKKNKNGKKQNQRGIGGIIAIYSIILVSLALAFFGVFFAFALETDETSKWFFYFLYLAVAAVLLTVGSVFAAYTQLCVSKDNELLISMPIPSYYIVASRLVSLFIYNLLMEFPVFVPAIVLSIIFNSVGFIGNFLLFIEFLILPFLTLAVSALIGFFFAFIMSKVKNKTVIYVISILFFAALYFILYFKYIGAMSEMNADSVARMAGNLKASSPLVYHLGSMVSSPEPLTFLVFLFACLAFTFISVWLICRNFFKVTTASRAQKKREYKVKKEKANSPMISLIRKEIGKFFSSAAILLNESMGLIFMILLSGASIIKRSAITGFVSDAAISSSLYGAVTVAALSAIAAMVGISASSISLEAKTLWILRSSPIKSSTVLHAKALAQSVVTVPVVFFSALILNFSGEMPIVFRIMLFVLPSALSVISGYFGAYVNLMKPKFDWINETVAVKQSAAATISVLVTMFGGFAVAMGLVIVQLFLGTVFEIIAYAGLLIFSALFTFLIAWYFNHNGARRLERLG